MNALHATIFFGLPFVAVLLLGLRREWGPIGSVGGGLLAGFVVLAVATPSANLGEEQAFGPREAFALCADTLRGAASGRQASVPWVQDRGGRGEHYFAWPSGAGLQLQRGGQMVDASASCIVDAASRRVVQLTVDEVSLR